MSWRGPWQPAAPHTHPAAPSLTHQSPSPGSSLHRGRPPLPSPSRGAAPLPPALPEECRAGARLPRPAPQRRGGQGGLSSPAAYRTRRLFPPWEAAKAANAKGSGLVTTKQPLAPARGCPLGSHRTKALFFSQHGQRPHLGGCSALSPRGPASAGRVVHRRAAPPQPGEPQHPRLPAAPSGRAAWGSAPARPAAAHRDPGTARLVPAAGPQSHHVPPEHNQGRASPCSRTAVPMHRGTAQHTPPCTAAVPVVPAIQGGRTQHPAAQTFLPPMHR